MEQLYERQPSEEEVADAMNISEDKLHETVSAGSRVLSVDAPLSEEDDTNLIDILQPEDAERPDDNIMQESLHKDITEIVATLNPLERRVLFQFFGIGYTHGKTLEEIASTENITKERARKIKERALNRLRNNENSKKLMKYL